jgi:lipoprotein-anchoring transpeptidase ErfK/SrfK
MSADRAGYQSVWQGGIRGKGRAAVRQMEYKPVSRRRLAGFMAGVSLAALAAAGCTAANATAVPAPRLTISPADGAQGIQPNAPISVTAQHGKLQDVTVRTAAGPVGGSLAANGIWHSTLPLTADTSYTVTATAIGADHKKVTVSDTFRTFTPSRTFTATITTRGTDPNISDLLHGHEYGVGIPITIMFSRPVSDKASVERAIQLRTSKPVVGAWHWQDDKTVIFRPRQYWPQYTDVTVDANFHGVQAAPGVYGSRDASLSFSIGPSLIVVASTRTHYMNVYYKDHFFGRWPISTGRPGDDTPDGTYLTTFKNNPQLMVGPGYSLEVPWSVDFTYTGDFIHDAYWSVSEQGIVNVSHGCVNTSPAHAEIYYKIEYPGDPVTVTGSPAGGTQGNGWTQWFPSWRQWLNGSATGDAVVAGPSGSSLVSPASLPAPTGQAPRYQPSAGNPRRYS